MHTHNRFFIQLLAIVLSCVSIAAAYAQESNSFQADTESTSILGDGNPTSTNYRIDNPSTNELNMELTSPSFQVITDTGDLGGGAGVTDDASDGGQSGNRRPRANDAPADSPDTATEKPDLKPAAPVRRTTNRPAPAPIPAPASSVVEESSADTIPVATVTAEPVAQFPGTDDESTSAAAARESLLGDTVQRIAIAGAVTNQVQMYMLLATNGVMFVSLFRMYSLYRYNNIFLLPAYEPLLAVRPGFVLIPPFFRRRRKLLKISRHA